MKKIVLAVFFVCLMSGVCLAAQSQAVDSAHTSENSLSWAGAYSGMLPGANSDIKTFLVLNYDGTYMKTTQYVDKGDDLYTDTGNFTWNGDGNTVTLDNDEPNQYFVGEGKLIQLDINGEFITDTEFAGSYVLKQVIRFRGNL